MKMVTSPQQREYMPSIVDDNDNDVGNIFFVFTLSPCVCVCVLLLLHSIKDPFNYTHLVHIFGLVMSGF